MVKACAHWAKEALAVHAGAGRAVRVALGNVPWELCPKHNEQPVLWLISPKKLTDYAVDMHRRKLTIGVTAPDPDSDDDVDTSVVVFGIRQDGEMLAMYKTDSFLAGDVEKLIADSAMSIANGTALSVDSDGVYCTVDKILLAGAIYKAIARLERERYRRAQRKRHR